MTTWDPSNHGTSIVLSGNNLVATLNHVGNSNWNSVLTNTSKTAGKWYAEFVNTQIPSGGGVNIQFGFCLNDQNVNSYLCSQGNAGYVRSDMSSFDGAASGGITYLTANRGFTTASASDVINFAIDTNAGKAWTGKNNTYGGNPAAGTNPTFTWTPAGQSWFVAWGCICQSGTPPDGIDTLQVGNQTYAPPAGFFPWDPPIAGWDPVIPRWPYPRLSRNVRGAALIFGHTGIDAPLVVPTPSVPPVGIGGYAWTEW